jgi:hypothetical protein
MAASACADPSGTIAGVHDGKPALYNLRSGSFSNLPKSKRIGKSADSGDWTVYATETEVRARNARTRVDRTLFDIKRPGTLLSQLRHAKSPDLRSLASPDLIDDPLNWAISVPLIAKHRHTAYFLTNAGTGLGAQGNTTFCFVAVNLRTGRITVMDKLGTVFGRNPDVFALSPDERKLLIASSVHDSAADNSFVVLNVNLTTGKTVNLLSTDPEAKKKANIVEGVCWSPDSRYIAVSVWYYDAEKVSPDDFHPAPSLEIKEASTGRTIETVKDFVSPAWMASE